MFSRLSEVRHGAFIRKDQVIFRDSEGEQRLFPVNFIRLRGVHNLENVLAACTMALLAGAPPESLEGSIQDFKGVEHRIEYVAEIDGVQYYNDSKATNVDAAIKSIESFSGNILLIAGGQDKGGDFSRLKESVRQRVKQLVLIGEATDTILQSLGKEVETFRAKTMEDAVSLCRKQAQPGDIVLLAPACASFDMFRDYEHRGRAFKDAVRMEIT
jgi:UDP-N-acetylmuramoylalanine--D-glutamate ligase